MLFPIGRIVGTPAALATLTEAGMNPAALLTRHVTGDWGKVDDHDKEVNDRAVKDGSRILSVYDVNGQDVWIITEWDRSISTILLPSEY